MVFCPFFYNIATHLKYKFPGDDACLAGMSIGPVSFHMFKQNEYDTRLPQSAGRIAVVYVLLVYMGLIANKTNLC